MKRVSPAQFPGQDKPEQLKMFMTPKEIMQQYQPLDGDRMEIDDTDYTTDSDHFNVREEEDHELWERKLDESQYDREIQHPRAGEDTGRSRTTGGRSNMPYHTWTGSTNNPYERVVGYERHQESESLYDSIERTGVQKPIHLGRQFGLENKPQVVGGHHRLASANDINPDMLVPVLHHEDIIDAKSGGRRGGYKYS
jgi:hypothetical protein